MRRGGNALSWARSNRWLRLVVEIALLALALVAMRSILVATTRLPNGDVVEYHKYALGFWTVSPLFTHLPTEYPPLAILPFSLTLAPPLKTFESVFSWWMAAAVIAGYLGFLRFSDRKRAIAYFVYLVIGAAGTVVARFDIFPALVTLGALWATQRRHFTTSYLLLAAGVLIKLYPVFLVPLPLIAHWQTLSAADAETARDEGQMQAPLRWLRAPATAQVAKGAALFVGAVGLGFALALLLDPSGALSEFTYASARPLQVESTPATLLWLSSLVGLPARPEFSFVSLNLVGPADVVLKPLSTVALAAGCLWIYLRYARERLTLAQAFLAVLGVVIVANKIFSPQYLIWIAPFIAEVYGFDGLWLLVCALTTLIFPYLYAMRKPIQTVTYNPVFLPFVGLRNLLLLSATLRAILSPAAHRADALRPVAQIPAETPARSPRTNALEWRQRMARLFAGTPTGATPAPAGASPPLALVVTDSSGPFTIVAAASWVGLVLTPILVSVVLNQSGSGLPLLGVALWLALLRVSRWLSPKARTDALARRGRYTEALALCDTSLAVTGAGAWVGGRRLVWLNRRVQLLLNLGRFDEALLAAIDAMEAAPDPETIANCAVALLRLNRFTMAIETARLASLLTNERSVRANAALAWAMLASGSPAESEWLAQASLADIRDLAPYVRRENHIACLSALCASQRAQGLPHRAQVTLARLRRTARRGSELAVTLLEEAGFLTNERTRARELVDRAWELDPIYTGWYLSLPQSLGSLENMPTIAARAQHARNTIAEMNARTPDDEVLSTMLRVLGPVATPRPAYQASASALLTQVVTLGATLALLLLWMWRFFVSPSV